MKSSSQKQEIMSLLIKITKGISALCNGLLPLFSSNIDQNESVLPSKLPFVADTATINDPLLAGLRCSRCGAENFTITDTQTSMLCCNSCGHRLAIRQTKDYWSQNTESLYESVKRRKKDQRYDIKPNKWHKWEDGDL